jgi:hypothetical protein
LEDDVKELEAENKRLKEELKNSKIRGSVIQVREMSETPMGGQATRLYWPIRSPNSVGIICSLATSFWRKDGRITIQWTKRACHILLGGKWLIHTETWGFLR